MLRLLFGKQDVIRLERTWAAPIDAVWDALTDPAAVREWWGPDHTVVTDCEVDARVGGSIAIVMEATAGMGRYAGTRWPMEATVTELVAPRRLVYDARSWIEGERDTTTIEHVNEFDLTETGDATTLRLTITVRAVGPGARMAAVGMRYGYKQYLDGLGAHLGA